MKQIQNKYLDLLQQWQEKHNVLGSLAPKEALSQSLMAIKNSNLDPKDGQVFVDIGAGAGMMGMAWLLSGGERVVFVEPDRKSSSFLLMLIASLVECKGKLRLVDLPIQDVTRETIAPSGEKILCVCRAFSPRDRLEAFYEQSGCHADPLFEFFIDPALPKLSNYALTKLR